MRQCKEGAYVGNWEYLNEGNKKIEMWSYIELSVHKTLNILCLWNVDLLME